MAVRRSEMRGSSASASPHGAVGVGATDKEPGHPDLGLDPWFCVPSVRAGDPPQIQHVRFTARYVTFPYPARAPIPRLPAREGTCRNTGTTVGCPQSVHGNHQARSIL